MKGFFMLKESDYQELEKKIGYTVFIECFV